MLVEALVRAALAKDSGPRYPFLDLVRSREGGAGLEIRERAEPTMLSMLDVNRAILQGLAGGLHRA
jgi:hypothetical protein